MHDMTIRYIDLFLASSITELHMDRLELGNFVRGVNDILLEKETYCRLYMCEDISAEVAATRKQDEYNDLIRRSRFCLVLIGERAGGYTIEELDAALEACRETGSPRVAVFFKSGVRRDASAEVLRQRLSRENPGLAREYTHIDEVKLALLQALSGAMEQPASVEVEEDRVLLDGRAVENIDPRNIPCFMQRKEEP